AFNGNLARERESWTSSLARFSKRLPIVRHFLLGKFAQDGTRQNLLDEEIVLKDHLLAGLGTQALQSWPHVEPVPVVPALRYQDRFHVSDALYGLSMAVGPVET